VSKSWPSESAPVPRAIARSMLSLGMEYDRAFSIAFCSARFPAGSGPPSFAATMIARDSFEKSLPRLASAAPFLCLIDDHLLCPDTRAPVALGCLRWGTLPAPPDPLHRSAFADARLRRLPHALEEQLVHAGIFGQLGVECGDENSSLSQQHRLTVKLGEHLDGRAVVAHARRADEHAPQRLSRPVELQVGFE